VVHFAGSLTAEIEGRLCRSEQFVFGVSVFNLSSFGRGNVCDLCTEGVIRFGDVYHEMTKSDLVGRGFVGKFIRGHGFNGGQNIFLLAGKERANRGGNGIFGLWWGCRRRLWLSCLLRPSGGGKRNNRQNTKNTFHESASKAAIEDK